MHANLANKVTMVIGHFSHCPGSLTHSSLNLYPRFHRGQNNEEGVAPSIPCNHSQWSAIMTPVVHFSFAPLKPCGEKMFSFVIIARLYTSTVLSVFTGELFQI